MFGRIYVYSYVSLTLGFLCVSICLRACLSLGFPRLFVCLYLNSSLGCWYSICLSVYLYLWSSGLYVSLSICLSVNIDVFHWLVTVKNTSLCRVTNMTNFSKENKSTYE